MEFLVHADSFNVIIEFCVLDIQSPYNAILGRPWIHMMRAFPSTHRKLLKYSTPFGMTNIRGDQAVTRIIAAVTRKRSGWAQAGRKRPLEQVLTKTLMWIRKRGGLLININHSTAKAEIPTHAPSWETRKQERRGAQVIQCGPTSPRADTPNRLKLALS